MYVKKNRKDDNLYYSPVNQKVTDLFHKIIDRNNNFNFLIVEEFLRGISNRQQIFV